MSRRHPGTDVSEPDRLDDLLRDLADDGAADPRESEVPADDLHADGGGRHRGSLPFLSVPRSVRAVDLAVGLRAVRGLLLVAVVVSMVLGGRWVWAVRVAAPEPAQQQGVSEAGGPDDSRAGTVSPASVTADVAAATRTAGSPPPTPPPTPPRLLVHVAGQVGAPGVVEVPAGARVIDAVEAAGGFTPEADQTVLNLARHVVDGEQMWVGRPGETPPASAASPPSAGMPSLTGDASGTDAGASGGLAAQPLNLNAATQADLESLPGIGPVTAGHILAWRDAHGPFSRVDELLEVSGIGERTLARLEPLVTVGG